MDPTNPIYSPRPIGLLDLIIMLDYIDPHLDWLAWLAYLTSVD